MTREAAPVPVAEEPPARLPRGPLPLGAAWLEETAEGRLGEFLASRGPMTHLVAPAALADALPPDPTRAFTRSDSLDDVPAAARVVIVASSSDEAGQLAEARRRWPGRRVLGLHHHVLPMRITDQQALKDVPPDLRLEAMSPWAIVCPARSGSTFLCALLKGAGLDAPREHLRRPLALAMRTPGVDAAETWRQVAARSGGAAGFGTKVVHEFLLGAADGRDPGVVMAPLLEAGARLVRLRRAALDTAVSRFLAAGAGRFHVRGALDEADRARFEDVAFDEVALRGIVARTVDDNAQVEAWAATLPAARCLSIDYAALQADPLGTLRAVAAFLGRVPRVDRLDARRLPVRISGEVGNSGRLREQLLAVLEREDPALARAALVA